MLINEQLAGLKVATEFGTIQFNEKGENNDLKPEEQKELTKAKGFEYVEDKPKAEPKPKTEPKAKTTTKAKPVKEDK